MATILLELALAVRKTGDLQRTDSLLSQALEISRQHRGEQTETYGRLLMNLGSVHLSIGNLTEARRELELSHEILRNNLGPLDTNVADAASQLASVFMWQDDLSAAERSAREAMEIFAAVRPTVHPDRVAAEIKLAQVLLLQNRIGEAATLFENSLVTQTQLYGPNSAKVADVLDSLAAIRKTQGSLREAEDYARQALQIQEGVLGSENTMIGYERTALAAILLQRGKTPEAQQQIERALEILRKNLAPDHQYIASAQHIYGEILLETGQLKDAEAVLTEAINRWNHNEAPAWRAARSESALGEVLYRLGRNADAERYLKRSYTALALDEHAERAAKVKAEQRIRQFYTDRGQLDELDALMLTTRGATAAATDRN